MYYSVMIIMDDYFVYRHVNKINNKQYIGITCQHPPENRWGRNGINYKESPHFWSAICKYGWDNFEHEILFSNLTKADACAKEIELIRQYHTQDKQFGYNIYEGGQTPSIPQETRRKMSSSMMGNKNGFGKKCSEETKKKISDAQKGTKFTKEHCEHISQAKRGKTHKPLDDIARKKISDAHDKCSVICQETGIVYESIQECARQLELYATLVCKVCKGKLHTTGGFHFTYYIE